MNSLFRFINASDKFKSDLILKVDCEMGQKEYTLLDYSHISF